MNKQKNCLITNYKCILFYKNIVSRNMYAEYTHKDK